MLSRDSLRGTPGSTKSALGMVANAKKPAA